MKNILSVVLIVAAFVAPSAAKAQEIRLRVQVPFDFVIGNKAYPAGEYVVSEPSLGNSRVVMLSFGDKTELSPLMPDSCESLKVAEHSHLIFRHAGDTYFLSEIWVAGWATGKHFPRSKAEIEMEARRAKAPDVIVAANLVH